MAPSTTSSIVENKTVDICNEFEFENDDVSNGDNNEKGKVNGNGNNDNNGNNDANNDSATGTTNIDHHVTQHSDPNINSDSGMMDEDDEDDKHAVGNDSNSRTLSAASDQPITPEQPTAQNPRPKL